MTDYTTPTQNGTGCRRCGRRTTRSRLCRDCARDQRHGDVAGGEQQTTTTLTYECTVCGEQYDADGAGAHCPECEAQRCRAVEEVA